MNLVEFFKANQMAKFILLGFIVIVVCAVGIIIGLYFSYNNKEIELRNKAEAQRGNIEAVYDKMWKVITEEAEVADKYSKDFKEIYPKIIEGRYSKGDGTLMKWINEHNPDFDTSLYMSLMESIESLRAQFQTSQKYMLDIIREHTTLCNSYPAKWFIKNGKKIEYTVVSSNKAKTAMASGVDDEVKLFN